MSQEYYSVEKETNLGTLNIGLNVFQSIIIETVKAMDGICFEGNMINIPGNLSLIHIFLHLYLF